MTFVFCFMFSAAVVGAADMDKGMMMHGKKMMKKAGKDNGKTMEKKDMMEKHDMKDMKK